MARILEIFQTFTDAFVTYKDPMANWVFYTRFYWLIEETRKFKEQFDAEEEVFNTPGYWELCEGEQERRLAPVYAAGTMTYLLPRVFNATVNDITFSKQPRTFSSLSLTGHPSKLGKTS
jgi:hypothetical protein